MNGKKQKRLGNKKTRQILTDITTVLSEAALYPTDEAMAYKYSPSTLDTTAHEHVIPERSTTPATTNPFARITTENKAA